ncbi:MAG TPA: hypothetical protein DIC52_08790 [Candidatus Latescibacteria bacterium]|nr:hypothetical protein [Candidatus Latescibacterota bacterium]|tara:strand:+ start:161 stop:427 length:267 start_codon:yes stop_codon:yes gene_type:complete
MRIGDDVGCRPVHLFHARDVVTDADATRGLSLVRRRGSDEGIETVSGFDDENPEGLCPVGVDVEGGMVAAFRTSVVVWGAVGAVLQVR